MTKWLSNKFKSYQLPLEKSCKDNTGYYVCIYVFTARSLISTPPPERPRLQLQPRTKPLEDTSGGRERAEGGTAASSIFGQAKPVDTAAKDKEIEERLLRVSKFS